MGHPAPPDWDRRYREGDVPWDTNLPSRELARVLDEGHVPPCRTIELGCGTGTNAVYLAQRGFSVTAVDVSPVALDRARRRAEQAWVDVKFVEADITRLPDLGAPFDFIFDRGCYHCVRRANLPGFVATLEQISRPGTRYLLLAGNANEQTAEGPPRVREHELRADLESLFTFQFIREFRFQDPGGTEGPLGWSCLLTRRQVVG